MRKPIGWQETADDGLKYRVRVSLNHDGTLYWRRLHRRADGWTPFEPAPAHWELLMEKLHNRYVRREAPYEDLLRLITIAAANDIRLSLPKR